MSGDQTTLAACTWGALLVSLEGNALIYLVLGLFGRATVGLTEVLVFSVLGVGAALVLRALAVRWAKQPARTFRRICVGVVLVYALGPLLAATAPYMEGAERFTPATVLATELMHLVSGAAVALALVPGGPELSLVRFARRLHMPALAVAVAIVMALAHLASCRQGLVVEITAVRQTQVGYELVTSEPRAACLVKVFWSAWVTTSTT